MCGLVAVDEDEGDAFGEAEIDAGVAPRGGCQDKAVHLPREQPLDDAALPVGVGAGVGDDRNEALGVQGFLDTAQDRRKDGVGDVGQHDADHVRTPRAQAGGEGVRVVAKLGGDGEDARGHLVGQQRTRLGLECPRDGRGMNAGSFRYVQNGDPGHGIPVKTFAGLSRMAITPTSQSGNSHFRPGAAM